MMSKYGYKPFNSFIFRVPLYPFKKIYSFNIKDPVFNEALYLASPEFYAEKLKNEQINNALADKLLITSYKYYSRACTRCTPFGLFAGCSIGQIGQNTDIILGDISDFRRSTRLDMTYLCALIQYLESQPEIRNNLLYYPNDSIYNYGEKIRYVEYYYKGTFRKHNIQSVDFTDYLEKILVNAKKGARINELAMLLIDNEITLDEGIEFINELINNQLLKSEIEASVTGDDLLTKVIEKLRPFKGIDTTILLLEDIRSKLSSIDIMALGSSINKYRELSEKIKTFPVVCDEKFLFQTDLYVPTIGTATISERVIHDIWNGLEFLNSISLNNEENNLNIFKKKFFERFENARIPLLQALDPELGLGYPEKSSVDINPLINDLFFPESASNHSISLSQTEVILLRKYIKSIKNRTEVIEISEEDFPKKESNWDEYNTTIPVMCQILKDHKDDRLIYLSSVGGSSAANLISRFCHLDYTFYKHARNITNYEQSLEDKSIYADIVHLPESRTGNILARPLLRDYEIHYLAKSSVALDCQIPLSDLEIFVKNNRICLKSNKLDKEIIPRLSNAHNYSNNSMPVYHFLCDMQHQDKKQVMSINYERLIDLCNGFPRIMYKNIILGRATWILKTDDIKGIVLSDEKKLKDEMVKILHEKKVPEQFTIHNGDNELFIDCNNILGIKTLVSIIQKRKKIQIKEFLYKEVDSIIRNNDEGFCGEFIFAFKKYEK